MAACLFLGRLAICRRLLRVACTAPNKIRILSAENQTLCKNKKKARLRVSLANKQSLTMLHSLAVAPNLLRGEAGSEPVMSIRTTKAIWIISL
ncbi:hypothetical protein DL98DRAFT_509303 [Cadophora sp. DSE1049]|nr:hypothetical protein DL98DRAFT_509303 [Cadophora sp. DSE1049]